MGFWRVPEKVLLPADLSGAFAHNGRLANGDQVMAYIRPTSGQTYPPSPNPRVRLTAVLFRFSAEGVLLAVDFASTNYGGDYLEQDQARGWQRARELLDGLVARVKGEGWVPADILVRPFFVKVDGLETGLVYTTDREDESDDGEDVEHSPECARLVPFDKIFHRPWNTGDYDT